VLKNAPTDIALIQILKLLSSIPITILRGVKRGETKKYVDDTKREAPCLQSYSKSAKEKKEDTICDL